MTMNSIAAKLRKKNKNHYSLLQFCTALSVMLVTSFALMFYSPTVQTVLPEGGDSRKQALMIFVIAIAGCSVFTTYASALFFRYKSREFGIFMALGEQKKQLKKVLFGEIRYVVFSGAAIGLIASIPLSYMIWKVFQIFIVDTHEMAYQFSPVGFAVGVAFCLFVISCIFVMGLRFVKKSNVIEMITESRKTETQKEVKAWYGKAGWVLFIAGIALGYLVPGIVIHVLHYKLPSLWNVTYVFSAVGIYMIMLHTITYSHKGNKKKYYGNILSVNMMRFMGKQTVRNMCVIAFLIAGALFAAFYVPTVVTGMFNDINAREMDYTFSYPHSENQIQKDEIYALADEYGVVIQEYMELDALTLIIDGIEAMYEGNNIVDVYFEKYINGDFIKVSDYNALSGDEIVINEGEYYRIVSEEYQESIWEQFDNLGLITHPTTEVSEEIKYVDVMRYTGLVLPSNAGNLYVISDADYERFSEGLDDKDKHRIVTFSVENPDETYEFAKALKDEIIVRSSEEVAVISSYDNYMAQCAAENGEEYWADYYELELTPENSALYQDWKYYPQFNVLSEQDLIKNMAVFLMLFVYIAIICFVAVSIIAYTRSMTIAMDNKQVFRDLKRLGANNHYIGQVVRKQLSKIFIYPTLVGSTAMYLFYIMIMWGNDAGAISQGEKIALAINAMIIVGVVAWMYGIYKLALKRVKQILEI